MTADNTPTTSAATVKDINSFIPKISSFCACLADEVVNASNPTNP